MHSVPGDIARFPFIGTDCRVSCRMLGVGWYRLKCLAASTSKMLEFVEDISLEWQESFCSPLLDVL